ncbi:2-amino-4-hydroxy-6-hydroxymethyldihydropteridine diphosphokinase [Pseudolysinimonas sp.]|uniref:2-amino-4-hydroxy-6- hydroxymethyldihydropteridine diphosphokinase n=1 Tax=Pseudolysinimonas sp. TaxID=2680009 RepID=UPI00286C0BED|nr:2-amino-4-hydroxy-6-hydroxymethyldihydropteridine diphosphokinase [Pseudolysinimonas sp.]
MNVQLRRIEADAVIAIGSNLGDRAATFSAALRALAEADGIEVTAISSPIETVAVRPDGEDPDAPAYLNAVVLVRTTLAPRALLSLLNDIEREHGRVRGERWGDRTLDLDIIDYAGLQSSSADLTLPHPRAHERTFVLRPWAEVAPEAVLPGHGRIADLLATLEGR